MFLIQFYHKSKKNKYSNDIFVIIKIKEDFKYAFTLFDKNGDGEIPTQDL